MNLCSLYSHYHIGIMIFHRHQTKKQELAIVKIREVIPRKIYTYVHTTQSKHEALNITNRLTADFPFEVLLFYSVPFFQISFPL